MPIAGRRMGAPEVSPGRPGSSAARKQIDHSHRNGRDFQNNEDQYDAREGQDVQGAQGMPPIRQQKRDREDHHDPSQHVTEPRGIHQINQFELEVAIQVREQDHRGKDEGCRPIHLPAADLARCRQRPDHDRNREGCGRNPELQRWQRLGRLQPVHRRGAHSKDSKLPTGCEPSEGGCDDRQNRDLENSHVRSPGRSRSGWYQP